MNDGMSAPRRPIRVLFVFAWLVVGGEESEVRLLARHLDPRRFRLDVVACFRKPGMTEQTHRQLGEAGIPVDTTPYAMSFEETVAYLASILSRYDVVVACQAVPDIHPALRLIPDPPPLIEHGGLVEEAQRHALDRTARYVGVCAAIRDAAAARMPERPEHALLIPSMVDVAEVDRAREAGARASVRAELDVADDDVVVGWVGRLDRKKHVEDVVRAASLVTAADSKVRFVIVGGADAFMPEYEAELHALAGQLGLGDRIRFLGDRADIPALLVAFDIFTWVSRGEGMPHVIAEAGAASLPVVATRDHGTLEQLDHEETGLFVEHGDPVDLAAAVVRLVRSPALRARLGAALRGKVEREYRADLVAGRWAQLLEDVAGTRASAHRGTVTSDRERAADETGRYVAGKRTVAPASRPASRGR